jgi:hypothetical protein
MHQMGQHSVTGSQAASAAIRALEGDFQHMMRAAETFLGKMPAVAAALQSVFSFVGGLAIVGVFVELGKNALAFAEKIKLAREEPQKIADGYARVTDSIRVSNAELQVENDKLQDVKNKFEGKPKNSIKDALDDADLAAEKLNADLVKVVALIEKTGKDNQVSLMSRFMGSAGSSDLGLTDQDKSGLTAVQTKGIADLYAATTSTQKYNAAINETIGAINILGTRLGDLNEKRATTARIIEEQSKGLYSNLNDGNNTNFIGSIGEQKKRLAVLDGQIPQFQAAITALRTRLENTKLNADPETHEQTAKGAKPEDYEATAIARSNAERQKKLALERSPDPLTMANALAEAYGKSTEQLVALNLELEKQHKTASLSTIATISGNNIQNSLGDLRKRIGTKQDSAYSEGLSGAQRITEELATQNTKHQEQLALIDEEWDAVRKLAAAESQGSDAVAKAQLAVRLASIKDPDIRQVEQFKGEAEYAAAINKTVTELTRETDAVKTLTAAQNGGRDAQRAAELKNIANSGESPDVIRAQTSLKRAQFGAEDAASGRGMSAAGGYKKFFQDLSDNTKSAGQQVQEVLGGAFDSLNSSMQALISGQKVSWSSLFRGLAAQIAGLGLNRLEGMLGGALSGGFGGGFGGGGNGDFGGETGGGGFFSKLFGGFRAGGGPTDSGKAYVVGENGPELFTPGSGGGSIIPNRAMAGAGGGGTTVHYTINAQGADVAAMEQRVNRSLVAVHGQAVRSSVQTQTELAKRRPR